MLRILIAVGIALGLAAPAWAGWDEGWAAYEQGDYEMALQEWRPLAEQGDADAQYNLGVMYQYGRGVAEDPAEAATWYRKAAEQGDAGAQYNLGVMYVEGQGVAQDYDEAVAWYRKAAEQGDAFAMVNLAAMYSYGKGVPRDYVRTHMWTSLAASRLPQGEERDLALGYRAFAESRMTSDQVAEAERLASEWMEQHASD